MQDLVMDEVKKVLSIEDIKKVLGRVAPAAKVVLVGDFSTLYEKADK